MARVYRTTGFSNERQGGGFSWPYSEAVREKKITIIGITEEQRLAGEAVLEK